MVLTQEPGASAWRIGSTPPREPALLDEEHALVGVSRGGCPACRHRSPSRSSPHSGAAQAAVCTSLIPPFASAVFGIDAPRRDRGTAFHGANRRTSAVPCSASRQPRVVGERPCSMLSTPASTAFDASSAGSGGKRACGCPAVSTAAFNSSSVYWIARASSVSDDSIAPVA